MVKEYAPVNLQRLHCVVRIDEVDIFNIASKFFKRQTEIHLRIRLGDFEVEACEVKLVVIDAKLVVEHTGSPLQRSLPAGVTIWCFSPG